jgi:hypothetical protein
MTQSERDCPLPKPGSTGRLVAGVVLAGLGGWGVVRWVFGVSSADVMRVALRFRCLERVFAQR